MFEKLFHLSENKTSVKTELIAGQKYSRSALRRPPKMALTP